MLLWLVASRCRISVGQLADDLLLPSCVTQVNRQVQKIQIIVKLQDSLLQSCVHSMFVPLYLKVVSMVGIIIRIENKQAQE
jgi:hypothetical protein